MKFFTKVSLAPDGANIQFFFSEKLILAPSGKLPCILSREKEGGRQPWSLLLVSDQPTIVDSTEDGTLGIKKYHVLQLVAHRTVFQASFSVAL